MNLLTHQTDTQGLHPNDLQTAACSIRTTYKPLTYKPRTGPSSEYRGHLHVASRMDSEIERSALDDVEDVNMEVTGDIESSLWE